MARGKPDIDFENCIGCELCVGACPMGVMKISKDLNERGLHYAQCIDETRCNGCAACASICPIFLITVWKFSFVGGG